MNAQFVKSMESCPTPSSHHPRVDRSTVNNMRVILHKHFKMIASTGVPRMMNCYPFPVATFRNAMGNVNASAVKVDALRPGDHIFIYDRTLWPLTYQHHGIVWKSDESVDNVQVCHVWTPLEGLRQAQADSSFRVSTLEQFLYHRHLNDLRLVKYDSNKASRPDIVLTRCRLLLGRGRGDYHPILQNCEHAVRWCKTGSQWSSQTLTPGHGSIPFEDQLRAVDVLAMKHQVAVMERDTAPLQCLRIEIQGRTLFWLDSFSAEMINVRQGLARQVFKLPPVSDGSHWFRHVEFATTFLKTPVTFGMTCVAQRSRSNSRSRPALQYHDACSPKQLVALSRRRHVDN